jgi:hypothetical protein
MASKIRLGHMTIDELRALISKTQTELVSLEAAPLPLPEATTMLTRGVDGLAAEYRERLGPLLAQIPRGQPVHELLALLSPDERMDPRMIQAFFVTVLHEPLLALRRGTLQEAYERDAALTASAVPTAERPARRTALA